MSKVEKICIVIIAILAVIGQHILYEIQTKNIDDLSPELLYEITLIKNGVAR